MEKEPFESLTNANQVLIADVVNPGMMLDPDISRFLKVPCLEKFDLLIISRPDRGSPFCDLFLHDESAVSHRLIVLYFSQLHYNVVHLPTQFSTADGVVDFMQTLIPPGFFTTHKMASAIPHERVELFFSICKKGDTESDDDSDDIVRMAAGRRFKGDASIEQRKESLMPRKEDDADDEDDGDEDEGDSGSDHGDGGSGGFTTPKKHLSHKKQRRE